MAAGGGGAGHGSLVTGAEGGIGVDGMRIARLQVHRFGTLRDLDFTLESSATLIYGPNEAGKSTLLEFVRAILFGFPARGGSERLLPLGGGSFGGAVTLEDPQGRRIRVERFDSPVNGRGKAPVSGSVRVIFPDWATGGERELAALLGGVSSELFRSLFAFGLTELQELGTLQSEEISGFLYSAGLGTSSSALRTAERKLAQELEQLYRPRGRTPLINRALQDLTEAERELARSRGDAERYYTLQEQLARLGGELERLEAEQLEGRRHSDWLHQCLRARPHWLRLRELNRELAELPELDDFPDDAVTRLEALETEQEQLAAQTDRLGLAGDELAQEMEGLERQLSADGDVLAHQIELEQLLDERAAYEETLRQITRAAAEEEQLDAELERLLRTLGPEWSVEHLDRLPVLVMLREQAIAFRDEWNRQRQAEAAEGHELERLLQELSWPVESMEKEEVLQRLLAAEAAAFAQAQEEFERVQAARRLFYDWKAAKQEARHAEERQRDWQLRTEPEPRSTDASSALPLYAVYALTLLVPAVLAALHDYAAAGIAFAALLAGSAVWTRLRGRRRGRRQRPYGGTLAAEAPTAAREQAQAATLEAALAAELRRLPRLAGGPTALEAAAARQAAPLTIEGLEPQLDALDRQLRAREAQHAGRRAAAERLQALLAQRGRPAAAGEPLRRRWGAWLRELALPEAAGPDAALALLQLAEQAQQQLQRLRRQRAAREALQRTAAAFAAAVGSRLGAAASREPGPALKAWQAARDRQLALQQQLAQGRRQQAELRRQAALLEPQRERVAGRLRELLQAAGADGAEALRRRAREAQQRKQRLGEQRQAELAIATLVGDAQVERLDDALRRSDAEALQRELERLDAELAAGQARIEACREEKSRAKFELERLAEGGDHAEKLQRVEERRAEVQQLLKRWGVLAMCSTLFSRTKQLYEHEKQPSVMQRASGYFEQMTGGRFTRMVAPLGEYRVLAEKATGELLTSSQLSRGTAEQMYLCIRFALVDEYAASGIRLPLVIDDLFVNFDDERLEQGMALLRTVAERHQLLLFTCHRHVLEAYARQLPDESIIRMG
ncbi:AAA family ATPase [Paenibacillus cremeus]|uniref:AAA family ATPase n=1 Tax=Paenibacillus cremeus TaxID=2163881 RepID=A0A559K835_9BACL|nr:AAA family ATPase [Paenibacillus cremeus]TVY08291.1 AAA family ATPase [Paenibacillus cremeus]